MAVPRSRATRCRWRPLRGGTYANATGTCAPASTNASTAVTCTATGLTAGTAYYFKVAAINSVGTGSYSAASSGATPMVAPAVPALSEWGLIVLSSLMALAGLACLRGRVGGDG